MQLDHQSRLWKIKHFERVEQDRPFATYPCRPASDLYRRHSGFYSRLCIIDFREFVNSEHYPPLGSPFRIVPFQCESHMKISASQFTPEANAPDSRRSATLVAMHKWSTAFAHHLHQYCCGKNSALPCTTVPAMDIGEVKPAFGTMVG